MKITLCLLVILGLNGCQQLKKNLQSLEDYKNQIFPLAGNWGWTYKVVTFGGMTSAPCLQGLVRRTVLGSTLLANRTATLMSPICAPAGAANSPYSVTGDQVWQWNGSEWISYLDAPLTDGRSFFSGLQIFTWFRPNSITVPAGTFTDCWTKKDSKSDSFETFCRGIGLVASYKIDVFGNGWKASLERISGPVL